jgi:hypothetical protein
MSLKFKFDLNSNWFVIFKTDLKKKKNFLIGDQLRAEFGVAQPASLLTPGLRGPAGRRHGPADSRARTA